MARTAVNPPSGPEALLDIARALHAYRERIAGYHRVEQRGRLQSSPELLLPDSSWPHPLDGIEVETPLLFEGRFGELMGLLHLGERPVVGQQDWWFDMTEQRRPVDLYGLQAGIALTAAQRAVYRLVDEVAALAAVCDVMKSGRPGTYVKFASRERAEAAYFDGLEVAYIRLCGFWDRAAQLLAFVFFNIREFDRDVFATTLDRIRVNVILPHPESRQWRGWKNLFAYRTETGEPGYDWLSSRRNKFTHSASLQQLWNASQHYGALTKARVFGKVSPAQPEVEMTRLAIHVRAMRTLVHSVVDLCLAGIDEGGCRPWRLRPPSPE